MDRTFSCPKCGRVLQAPQGQAGDLTRCPDCRTVFAIPATSADGPSDATDKGSARPVGADDPLYGNPRRAPFALSSEDVLRQAWQVFRRHTAALFGVYLLAVTLAILLPAGLAAMIVKFGWMPIDRGAAVSLWMLLVLAATIHGLWLEAGLARYLLARVRGGAPSWTLLFRGARGPDRLLLVSAVRVPVAAVGLLLGVFPGVFWWLMSSLAVYAVVDSDDTPWQAIREVRRSAAGQWETLTLVFAIASFGLLCPLPPTGLLLGPPLVLIPAVVCVRLAEEAGRDE